MKDCKSDFNIFDNYYIILYMINYILFSSLYELVENNYYQNIYKYILLNIHY